MNEKDRKKTSTLRDVQRDAPAGVRFYDPAQKPFAVYGVLPPDADEDRYRRMPFAVAEKVNEVTTALYANTSGGRIRFCTDARHIHLKAFYPNLMSMGHFAQSGVSGFSVYTKEADGIDLFRGVLHPNDRTKLVLDGSLDLRTSEMREVTICMPLYNDVDRVFVGLDEAARVLPDGGYAFDKPVVFYGSSITQGGCASRPGSEYAALLSRRLRFDYVNLGFSGGARGEKAIAEYIKTLPMLTFVMDYDHNAPSPEALVETHEAFFRTIRSACPTLPIVLVSRPGSVIDDDNRRRFSIIRQTYENAVAQGDRNVYLLDGAAFFADALGMNDPTVDLVHPTDLGFFLMAQAMEPCLKTILQTVREAQK